MRAKVDLLRRCAERSRILDDDAKKYIKITLDAVNEYKGYWDNLTHSMPFDINRGIVHTFKYGTEMTQTLVTQDALNGVYLRLKLLLDELRELDLLYRLADETGAFAVYPDERDPIKRRRRRDVPIQTARLRECQKERLSLPQLPQFPDEGVSLREDPEAPQ